MRRTISLAGILSCLLLCFSATTPTARAARPAQQQMQAELDALRVRVLPAPPFHRQMARAPRPVAGSARLALVSSRPNNVTDVEQWFARHDIALPIYEVADTPYGWQGSPAQPLSANIPTEFRGQRLIRAIRQPRGALLIYGQNFSEGRYLLALDAATGRFRYGFDFTNYAYAPDNVLRDRQFVYQSLTWAAEDGDTLYVSHSHPTYARSSRGMNAYITALRLPDGQLLWRSPALVSNAQNFEVAGDALITGYGFTNEPDYLYLLDKRTGQVRQRINLRTGPSHIIRRGHQIHVRTYNADMVFRIESDRRRQK